MRELKERLGGLPKPLEAAEIWRDIWFEETHHSTAIEGNTLVLKQVQVLLAEGRAIGDKELREYMEVRGYADASEWVYGQGITSEAGWSTEQAITLTEIREIHRRVLAPVWEVAPHPDASEGESPGHFRTHEIRPFPGGMTPPSWPLVPAHMETWITAANSIEPHSPEFAERLAQLHGEFERIHPFLDGNGRAGRLVMNLMLVRLGYPPAIIYKRQRSEYLKALQRTDAGDVGALGELLARAILNNLYRFVVPAVAGPSRLVPLAALATSEVSAGALRVAASRGRLQASLGPDGQWRSSRNWVDEYVRTRFKAASPPTKGTPA